MDIEFFKNFFLYGFLINLAILFWWAGFLFFLPDWIYKAHRTFVGITREQFNGTHYAGLAFYKLANFVFFGVPYIVLVILS
ncbi:MAG: hypothetical protein KC493_01475 [Bacteriovoracaceae bacterium]|nr:hypothetical protein [Bacteriovoracaceae bacterium]